ncbi:hypothetical protein [Hymenobacter ruricola]|uniref:DUF2490 domain-containing protein n=1 Tax=Hymenobacter ruricola TaxID=2791023 RepID=A0ABS0I003_9BACT|nr:hypothetical protein [Hymenobacter ruricola]MBF9220285.1 hypothetical protein [Hymenobacter ruricola]
MKLLFSATAALVLWATVQNTQGQSLLSPADTARTYQHHLGLTASPQLDHFFTANRSLPIGLLYRKQTQPNRAWRARVVARYEFNSGDAPLQIGNSYREHTGSVELAWGRERWLPLNRRFMAYAGGEVGARLDVYRKNSEYYRLLPRFTTGASPLPETAVTDQQEHRTTQSVFLQAFAGIRLRISQRLFAEAESGLPLTFSHQKWNLDGVEYYVSDRTPSGAGNKGDNTYYTIKAQFNPVCRLHCFFLF